MNFLECVLKRSECLHHLHACRQLIFCFPPVVRSLVPLFCESIASESRSSCPILMLHEIIRESFAGLYQTISRPRNWVGTFYSNKLSRAANLSIRTVGRRSREHPKTFRVNNIPWIDLLECYSSVALDTSGVCYSVMRKNIILKYCCTHSQVLDMQPNGVGQLFKYCLVCGQALYRT